MSFVRIARFAAIAAVAMFVAAGAAAAQDKPGAPLQLVPSRPEPAPVVKPAAPVLKDAEVPTGFQATPLGPLDPSWAGALPKDEASLPPDMWRGTERATVRAVLPMIGATESPALRNLARRLLLSGAVAPEGHDPADATSLLLLRAERLAALGAIPGAKTVLDTVPADRRGETAERLRIELDFAANDVTDGCRRVAEGLAAHRNVWWDRANIACQLLSGARDQAALAIEIMRDGNAPPDPVFDTLVAAARGEPAHLEKGAALTPLRVTLWAAGKHPLPDSEIDDADAPTLAAFAGAEDEPPANRLAAAERAAAIGAWPPERLATLYAKAATDGGSGDTPAGRAASFAVASHEGDTAQRVEALPQFLDSARRHGLFHVASRLAAPIIVAIGPNDAAKNLAPLFIRALIAADRPQDIAPFVPSADPGEIAPLLAIVHAIDGGATRPDASAMDQASAALALRPSDSTPRQIGLFLTLATEYWGAIPAPQLAAQMAPPHPATMPSAALWLAQQDAETARRVGETVLTSIVVAGEDGGITAEPIRLRRAIEALRAVGLDADARSLAREAAVDGGL